MLYQLNINPADKLFFRDARPIGGSNVGNGSGWPLPSVLHSALQSAIYEYWCESGQPDWESNHTNFTDKEKDKQNKGIKSNYKLGGLKTIGPFPQKDGEIYFPTPADIESNKNLMSPIKPVGNSNLPKPLIYSVVNRAAPTKDVVGQWISASELKKYIEGEVNIRTTNSTELFISESNPGVAIDPETGTNVDGKFFQSEYLRLLDDKNVSIATFGECLAQKYNAQEYDIIEKLFSDNKQLSIIMGGQRGTAYVECIRSKNVVFEYMPSLKGNLIKWTLLAPAVFSNGWCPDWIDKDNGSIELKCRPERNSYKSRKEWREAINKSEKIKGKLVAARIPKPIYFSGWKLDIDKDNAGGIPKATQMAVPAGAVYYFECDDENDAEKLCKELHGNIKSTHYGNHGFGLGICCDWSLLEF